LDMLVLWSALPGNIRAMTRPVAAKDYWDKGMVRRYIATKIFDALLIDRKEVKVHQSPVELMIREIGQTKSLIMFPEGQRNTGEEIGEFKSGLYYLSKKWPDMELMPVPLLSCITFGSPIWLEKGEPKNDFLNRAREAVRRLKDA
jgi:1-acyl-sn-glycerol-3-phosphate acyltransferase